MTKPSRRRSKGMETPRGERAVMLVKQAMAVSVRHASELPASMTSQRPVAIRRAPLATLWVPAAQAVTVFSQGPRNPYRMDRLAADELAIIMVTRKGLTLLAPLS